MKKLLLALTLTVAAANAEAQVQYEVRVVTADANGVARQDGFFIDRQDARTRADHILASGWVIFTDGGRYEERYPARSIVKVIVVDPDPLAPQCPPDCPPPSPRESSDQK